MEILLEERQHRLLSPDHIFTTNCLIWRNLSVQRRVVLTLDPNWSDTFYREAFTLRCEIQEGGNTGWTYEWTKNTINIPTTTSEYRISNATTAHRGSYRCRGRTDSSDTTQWIGKIQHTLVIIKLQSTLSPVHPVTEGQPLTLSCRLWTDGILSDVSFYKNGKLIQNGTSGQLNISAVSKSDEGFYQCERTQVKSLRPQVWKSSESWASVKCKFNLIFFLSFYNFLK
uniref:Ig-like domain-containing protein n=1 Tax=Sphaeramia orbicularis TaxID=375764 RepID=A0A672Y758_9TELE